MRFSDKLQIGEIKIKKPQDIQEWMREVLRIILDSGNGESTLARVKKKISLVVPREKEENV